MLTPGLSQHCASLQRRSLCPIAPLRRPHCSGDGEPLGAAVPPPRPQPRDGPVGGERRGTEGHGLRLREDQDRSSAAVGRRMRTAGSEGAGEALPGRTAIPSARPVAEPRRQRAALRPHCSAARPRGTAQAPCAPPLTLTPFSVPPPGNPTGIGAGGGGTEPRPRPTRPRCAPGSARGGRKESVSPPAAERGQKIALSAAVRGERSPKKGRRAAGRG